MTEELDRLVRDLIASLGLGWETWLGWRWMLVDGERPNGIEASDDNAGEWDTTPRFFEPCDITDPVRIRSAVVTLLRRVEDARVEEAHKAYRAALLARDEHLAAAGCAGPDRRADSSRGADMKLPICNLREVAHVQVDDEHPTHCAPTCLYRDETQFRRCVLFRAWLEEARWSAAMERCPQCMRATEVRDG